MRLYSKQCLDTPHTPQEPVPTVTAYPTPDPAVVRVCCPYCDGDHYHGRAGIPGLLQSHCHDGGRAYRVRMAQDRASTNDPTQDTHEPMKGAQEATR
jgi:hypothetical protein